MQYNQYNVLISLQNYTVPSVPFVLSNKLTKMPSYELFDNIYIQVAKLVKTTHLFLTELQFFKRNQAKLFMPFLITSLRCSFSIKLSCYNINLLPFYDIYFSLLYTSRHCYHHTTFGDSFHFVLFQRHKKFGVPLNGPDVFYQLL